MTTRIDLRVSAEADLVEVWTFDVADDVAERALTDSDFAEELASGLGGHPDLTYVNVENVEIDNERERVLLAVERHEPATTPDGDRTVWRITRQDILDRCSGERVLPITDEQFERIAKAIDYSSVSECIEGAIGQVVPYTDDEETP